MARLTDIPFDPTKQDQRNLERESHSSSNTPTKDDPKTTVVPPASPSAKPKTEGTCSGFYIPNVFSNKPFDNIFRRQFSRTGR